MNELIELIELLVLAELNSGRHTGARVYSLPHGGMLTKIYHRGSCIKSRT
jgi:hypothetical protein